MPQTPDDQTKALLETVTNSSAPKIHEMSVEDARNTLLDISKIFDMPPCDVGSVKDIDISYDGGDYKVRLYCPKDMENKTTPITILYHGGGFVLGDLETHDAWARYLCLQSGHKVVSVDYRLAPEYKFPAGLEDCYHALLWTYGAAKELGFDRNNISIIGDSAGGNLSAGVAQLVQQRSGPSLASVILLYPSCDAQIDANYPSRALYGNGDYFLGMKDMEWFFQLYSPDEDPIRNSLLSPIKTANFDNWPPTLIITAGMDILRDEGKAFYVLLKQHSVETEYLSYDGTIHGFVNFSGVLDKGKKCLNDVVNFLTTHERK